MMKTMIKNKSQILKEGRYDSFTRLIVNDIISSIKETEGDSGDFEFDLPYDISGENSYKHESGLDINLDLIIRRTNDLLSHGNTEVPYHINSYISEDDFLVVNIIIDNTYGNKFYKEIFYKLNEDVRHEIEHYLQNIFDDRQKPNIPNTAEYQTTFLHHMDPSEVEALVHGFYRRAKLEKKPLDDVMLDDIKSDIQNGYLTPQEGDELMKTWLKYAIKKLPQAQYSNNFRRNFIIQK